MTKPLPNSSMFSRHTAEREHGTAKPTRTQRVHWAWRRFRLAIDLRDRIRYERERDGGSLSLGQSIAYFELDPDLATHVAELSLARSVWSLRDLGLTLADLTRHMDEQDARTGKAYRIRPYTRVRVAAYFNHRPHAAPVPDGQASLDLQG